MRAYGHRGPNQCLYKFSSWLEILKLEAVPADRNIAQEASELGSGNSV